MTLHISAPYNIYRFCHLAHGGQSHFPSLLIPSSSAGHFPVDVKCLPFHSFLLSLESRVEVKIQGHRKKVTWWLFEPHLLDISVSRELIREIQVFPKLDMYFHLPRQSSYPREKAVSNIHMVKGTIWNFPLGAQSLILLLVETFVLVAPLPK